MSGVAYFEEVKRLRRSGLITLTLTDLLIVVVFVLLLFTFRSSEEGRVEISGLEARLQEALAERDRLRRELTESRVENELLTQQVHALEEFVQRLLNERQDPTLPAEVGRLQRLLENQQAELAEKNRQLQRQGRGTAHPRCLVTAGFLIEIALLESGYLAISPRWEQAADSHARAVPGVSELVDAGEVSLETFNELASHILAWSEAQEIPCRFHVDIRRETKNLDTYLQQMRVIDRYFYPKRY